MLVATKGAKVKKTRVFELARELGVSSKDVIEKCKSEEIPDIKGHMSAVSVGLEATIREWFSTGASNSSTAVETAAPVDVVKAQAKARKKASKKKVTNGTEAPPTEAPAVATLAPPVEVPPAPPAAPVPVAPPPAAPVVPEPIVVTPEPPAAPVEPPSIAAVAEVAEVVEAPAPAVPDVAPPEALPEIAADAPAEPAGPVMNVPVRPDKIAPAGPQLQQPTKTKLAGPKVIRVESPDTVPPPQPRRVDRGDRTGRGVGPVAPGDPFPPGMPIRGGEGRGAGGPTRRNQRRSASAGRDGGRTGRSMQGYGAGRTFNWREQDLLERERRLNRSAGFIKAARRDSQKRSAPGGLRALSAAHTGGKVKVEEPITIKELSAASGVKVNDIIRQLVKAGHDIARPDAVLTAEIAMEVMLPYDIELEIVEQKTAEQQIEEEFKERTLVNEQPRSPVITILGHVDHGKTTLLDRIRNANVAEGEAGGITQATSAFRVPVRVGEGERTITFIDTPGHEAFTEMRSRGAQVTDLVVLVVAADDGVMPQTAESISHAKAADVPIVVALNKVDKPEATDANIQRILGQLAEHDLNPVDWGGQTEIVRMSALKSEGIQDLLEVLDFQSQLLELTADSGGAAAGTVIEANLAEGRGPVANVLVRHGELKKGDYIVVGRAYGRVRNLMDDRGKQVKSALPSIPVAVAGLNEVPDAGDKFYVVKNQREAEAAASERKAQERERGLAKEKVTLDNIFEKLSESERKELPLIVKADVQGSLETLKSTLPKIGSEEVAVAVKHAAVGGVNESDVTLAEASGAIIVGFNVTTSAAARRLAEARSVDIRLYDVIYDLTDDVTRAAEGLLEPELRLEVLGHAEVRQVFKVSKVGMVAGCYVTEGTIERNAKIRVTRGDIVVEKDRRLDQLKRFKDDAKSVVAGQECGMRIDGYDDIKEGDVLECYKTLEVRRSLSAQT
jgi:translation initiation factor IF-2